MTIEEIEKKIKSKIAKYENELDEEFKELIVNYIKIFHSVCNHQDKLIQELQEKDTLPKEEIAIKLTELKNKYCEGQLTILDDYNFFLNSMSKKGLNIDEIEFKVVNE